MKPIPKSSIEIEMPWADRALSTCPAMAASKANAVSVTLDVKAVGAHVCVQQHRRTHPANSSDDRLRAETLTATVQVVTAAVVHAV